MTTATFEHPKQPAAGIQLVLVNGDINTTEPRSPPEELSHLGRAISAAANPGAVIEVGTVLTADQVRLA